VSDEKPQVDLTMERVCCSRHGEPFRAQWPKGWGVFTVALFRSLMGSDAFANEIQREVSRVNEALDHKPLCERATAEQLLDAYTQSGVGTVARCENCHRERLGTPYSTSSPSGIRKAKHLCFDCVLHRMRPYQ
jgi:hypothetical protein